MYSKRRRRLQESHIFFVLLRLRVVGVENLGSQCYFFLTKKENTCPLSILQIGGLLDSFFISSLINSRRIIILHFPRVWFPRAFPFSVTLPLFLSISSLISTFHMKWRPLVLSQFFSIHVFLFFFSFSSSHQKL